MFLFNKKNEKILSLMTLTKSSIASVLERPNFYGIFFFRSAEGSLEIEDQKMELNDHYIFFYYPYQKLVLEGSFQGILIQFHPDFFCIDIHAKDVGCQGLLFNNFFNDSILKCSPNEFNTLFRLRDILKEELSQKDIAQLDMVASQLKIFLIQAVRWKSNQQKEDLTFKEDLHFKIENLIERNFKNESSLDFYANKLEVSTTTFNRLCQKYFQKSFVTVLSLKKVAVAKNRLFLTNESIKDIAYHLGFNDPLYFSRVFRKYCGVSPKEFREQLKNNRLI